MVATVEIAHAAQILVDGGLVAFPTETVYGLGADVVQPAAVARIFELKGRPSTRPLIVHVAGPADLDRFASDVPATARTLAEAFWPGPLTVVVPKAAALADVVTGGGDTVGMRAPDHPVALELLRAMAALRSGPVGIAAPSANRFGEPPPVTAQQVIAGLGDGPYAVLDGGRCPGGVPSTVVDCTAAVPKVLRTGAVAVEAIEQTLGVTVSR